MSRTPIRRGVGYGTDSSVVTTPSSARGGNTAPRAARPPTTPRPQTTPNNATTTSTKPMTASSDEFAHHERNHSRELDEMRRVTTNMEKIHSACSGLVLSSDIALAALLHSEHSRKLISDAGESSGSGSGGRFTSAPKVPRRADTPSIPEQVRRALQDCASVGPSVDVSGRSATDTLTDILTRLQELQLSGGVSIEGSAMTPPMIPSLYNNHITRSGNTTPQLSSLVLPTISGGAMLNNNRTDINLGGSVGGASATPLSRALGVPLVAGDVSAGVTSYQVGREEGGQSPARQAAAIFDSSVDPNESIWPDVSAAQLALHEILLTTRNDPALRRRSSKNPSMSMNYVNGEESAAFQSIRASCRRAMMALYDATQGHAAVLRQRDQLALSSHTEAVPTTRRAAGFIDTQSANRIGSSGAASSSGGASDYLLCVAFDRPKRLRAHLLGSVFDAMRDTFKRFLKAAISRSQTARFVSEDHEGCAFILSFTSPLECVVFDYCIQRYAMYLPWPSDVLELPYAAAVNASADYAAKAATCAGKEMDWVNDAGRRIDQRGAVFKPTAVTKSEGPLGSSAPPSRPQSPGMDSQNSLQGTSSSLRSSQTVGAATTSTGSFVGATTGSSFSSYEVKEIRIARAKLAAIEQMFCVQVELLNGAAEERAQQAALRVMQQEQQEAAAATSTANTPVESHSVGAFPGESPRASLSGNTSPSASSVRETSRGQMDYDMDDPTELTFINRPPILPAEASAAQIAAAFQAHYASYSQRGPQIRSSIHFSSVDNFTRTAPFNVPQATVSGLCGLSLDGTTLSASVIDRPDMKAALEAVGGFMWEHSFPDMEACERDRIDEYGSSASRNTKETRLLCLLDLQEFCGVYRGYTLHYHRGRQCPNLIQRQARYRKAAAAASSKLNNSNTAVYYPPRIDNQFYDDTINESLSPTSTSIKVRRKSSFSSTFCATHLSENPAREGVSESYNPWWWCSDLPSINALTGDMGRMLALPTRSQACQTMPVQVVQLDEEGNPISALQHRRSRARSMARSVSPREGDRKSLFSNSVISKASSTLSPPTPIPRSGKSQKNSARNTPIPEPAAVAPSEAQVLELAEKLLASRRAPTADSGAQTQFGSYDRFPQSRIAKECVKELLYNPQASHSHSTEGTGSSAASVRSLDQIQAREAPTSYGYEGFTDTMATASSELMEWVNNDNNSTATDDSIVRFVSAMILGAPMPPRRGKINTAMDPRMSITSDASSSSIPPTPRGPNLNEDGRSNFAALIDSTIPPTADPNTFSTPPRHVNSDVLAYRAAVVKAGPSAIGTFLSQYSSSPASKVSGSSPHRQLLRVGPDPASLFRPADRGWEGIAKTYTQLLSSHATPGTTADDTYQRQCWGAGSANSTGTHQYGVSDRGTLQIAFRSEDAAVSRAVIASIFHAVSLMKEDYSRKLEYQRVVTVVALEQAQQRIHSLEERLSLRGTATSPPRGGGHAVSTSLGTSFTDRSHLPSPAASSRPSMATPNSRVSKTRVSADGLAKTPRPPRT